MVRPSSVTNEALFRPSRLNPRRAARLRLSPHSAGKLMVSLTSGPTKKDSMPARTPATRALSFQRALSTKTWTRASLGVMAVALRKPWSLLSSRTAIHIVRLMSGGAVTLSTSRRNSATLASFRVKRVVITLLPPLEPLDVPVDGEQTRDDGKHPGNELKQLIGGGKCGDEPRRSRSRGHVRDVPLCDLYEGVLSHRPAVLHARIRQRSVAPCTCGRPPRGSRPGVAAWPPTGCRHPLLRADS